ncbi:MAG: hypothetical protein J1E62_12160 [Lachnospiraceae bacterium]|nr:hypothetical protein [Lachnospiraceae bacterium]
MKMGLLNYIKSDSKDKSTIYRNANNSFNFDYSIQSGVDDNGKDEPYFNNANKCIDKNVTYEMKEVDYYA